MQHSVLFYFIPTVHYTVTIRFNIKDHVFIMSVLLLYFQLSFMDTFMVGLRSMSLIQKSTKNLIHVNLHTCTSQLNSTKQLITA